MGQFLVTMGWAAIVGALALAMFFHIFPHPDKQTAAIAIVVILIALAPLAVKLWRDLGKTCTPPKG
ncbi:hypothetical+protein [Methylocapsa aurea]|uniref:hypothetical protein n=1 Tax=Methylocapsa aurea TaxID=663610 RepID=UPI003D18F3D7